MPPTGPKKRFGRRRKVCQFCAAETPEIIDYKNVRALRKFVTERGKILPRRITGNCASHQRKLTHEINRARNIAFLPFSVES